MEGRAINEPGFPSAILRSLELSSKEAIVKYLRENRHMRYKDIATLLNRKPGALPSTYMAARKKKENRFSEDVELSPLKIDFAAFRSGLSILEAICTFLKSKGYTYSEIANITGRHQKTIWTACHRAEKKKRIGLESIISNKYDECKAAKRGRSRTWQRKNRRGH